jgi:hypothetical protein
MRTPSPRGWLVAGVTGAAAVALPYLLHAHGHHAFEAVPGFWAVFGGLGCALIVGVSKRLGAAILQKPEDWYER